MPKLNRLLLLTLVLLTACKREGTPASAEAEALDYVRLVAIALSNAYDQTGQPVPPTPCTAELFGMKKTSKFLKLGRCTAKMDSNRSYLVSAVFNGDIAVMSDPAGTRRVKLADLPEVK